MIAAPPQTRPALYTAFLAELQTLSVQVAFDRSTELGSSLPQTSPLRRPIALQTADSAETISFDDRPWELFEQLVPTSKNVKHVDQFLSSKHIRDTAALPISLFQPSIKRDPIPQEDVEEEAWESAVAERNLGDGLAGEPLSARQASTLLFALPTDKGPAAPEDADTSFVLETPKADLDISPLILTNSTPANRPRRASARSIKTGASTKDAIDLHSSDSEVEIVPAKRPRVGSKSSAAASGSSGTAAGRPSTGGKAPAKRTTGGKGIARKATGGKNVGRKGAGKAPKKR
jgi:mediator of RNA polymerase II transcription subunit 12